jgi:hypothetical protein
MAMEAAGGEDRTNLRIEINSIGGRRLDRGGESDAHYQDCSQTPKRFTEARRWKEPIDKSHF